MRRRHDVFREALEIIRLLWQGGYRSHQGKHLQLEDARVFDLPDWPPMIAVAASGAASATIAAELGDSLFATGPKPEIVECYRRAGGDGPRYGEVPVVWAPDAQQAAQAVVDTSRWALTAGR